MRYILKQPYIKTILLLLSIVFLFREVVSYLNIIPLKYLSTPLITTLILLVAILSQLGHSLNRYKFIVMMGLITALIADTLLMIVEVNLLQYGIVFFMITHILYLIAFSHNIKIKPWNIMVMIIQITAIVLFFFVVKGKTKGLDIPVLMYMILISTMGFFALTHINRGKSSHVIFLVTGALLFMVSDIILAVNAFLYTIPHSTVLTWATYAPAQLLIAFSCFDVDE